VTNSAPRRLLFGHGVIVEHGRLLAAGVSTHDFDNAKVERRDELSRHER